jgi:dinuclear metal center YbgI/SA1388 family protein
MPRLPNVVAALERIAPLRLAAEWDSVGLLVAPRGPDVQRVLTCLTLTPEVAAEAVRERIDLVITHHPLPFHPIGRLTPDTGTGRVLLTIVGAGCGIWSSHTAWDSAAGGINDQLAALAGLVEPGPITPDAVDPAVGFGRMGQAAGDVTVAALARRLAAQLAARGVQIVGDPDGAAGRVGMVCGSGGDLVGAVATAGCTTLVTGELKLHQAIEARAANLAVIAVGHHASEQFSLAELGQRLMDQVPGLETVVSREDRDPLGWL